LQKNKITSIGGDVEKQSLYIADGNVKLYTFYGRQYGVSSKN
jgi:hypothetical protein